ARRQCRCHAAVQGLPRSRTDHRGAVAPQWPGGMRIATWNVNSLRVRLPQVLDWLTANPVDVLALQETKLVDDQFPAAALLDAGYHAVFSGQKTYNGVAIVSREPAGEVLHGLPRFEDPQRRFLAATVGGVRIINVYVPNGQDVTSDKYVYKLDWLAR